MAKKRLTAEQRDEQAREALLRRVADMAYGACGEVRDHEDGLWPTDLAKLIPALQAAFESDDSWTFRPWQLEHFDCIKNAVNYLFRLGVRA